MRIPETAPAERPSNEQGAVLIEFSIVAWVFALLIVLTFDIGEMLHHYMVLSQLTFEGARTASMVDGLQKPLVLTAGPTEDEKKACVLDMKNVPRSSELPCALLLAQHRVRQSISFTDVSDSLDDFQVTTSYDGAAQVSVELQANYKALFLPLRFVPIRASTTLPYVILGAKEKLNNAKR